MKKVLIDINVLLDFLIQRENHLKAAQLYDAVLNKKVKGYLVVHEITTLAYFLEKDKSTRKHIKRILNNVLDTFSIIGVNESILRRSLDSKIKDYEDAVIDEASQKEKIDFIITNNLKDFKPGVTESITPEQLLAILSL